MPLTTEQKTTSSKLQSGRSHSGISLLQDIVNRQSNFSTPGLIFKFYVVLGFMAMALNFTGCSTARNNAEKRDWIKLFNGKDIGYWTVKINHHDMGEDPANALQVNGERMHRATR